MTNGGQSSRQDYFTGDTLSKFSGAVVIASLLTTAILMIFSTDTLQTGLAVGLTISVAKWLQDLEKGRIKFDPTHKKSRRIAKGINIALMVLVNGVLIFFSASSTRGFFFDQLAEPGVIEEQSSFVQSLAPAIGTSAANTEIGMLRANTAAMSDDITELKDSLDIQELDLEIVRGQLEIYSSTPVEQLTDSISNLDDSISILLRQADELEVQFMQKSDSLEGVISDLNTLQRQPSIPQEVSRVYPNVEEIYEVLYEMESENRLPQEFRGLIR